MAKGRKHGSDRHERLLGSFNYGRERIASSELSSELGEEDVWSTISADDMADKDETRKSSELNRAREDHLTRRWLDREHEPRQVGGLSLAFEDGYRAPNRVLHQFRNTENPAPPCGHHRMMAASVPMNVPDWRKILRADSGESMHDSGELDGDEREWVPPHEYLAREYSASGNMVATSVFEGVGRTLKGRDMSRVRDAVWSQTGFFG